MTTTRSPGETETTRDVLRRFYALFATEAGPKGALAEFYHEDIVMEIPSYLPHGGIHRGLDAIKANMPKASSLVDWKTIKVESITAEGNLGVGVLRVKILDHEDEVIIAEHVTVHEGKISSLRLYAHDPGPFMARMSRLVRQQAEITPGQ